MQIVYSARALGDLDSILDTIAAENPSAARNVAVRIEATVSMLAQMPRMGRRRSNRPEHIRAFPVRPYPYLVAYSIKEDAIEILTIWHMARDPKAMLE